MLTATGRLKTMVEWGKRIAERSDDQWEEVIHEAYIHNKWFTPENCEKALNAIITHYLSEEALDNWLRLYDMPQKPATPLKVGIVMAGNIPLVGFHDLLCVLMSGHKAMIKLSEKDNILMPFMLDVLDEVNAEFRSMVETVDTLKGFDAVIATGSDNSSRYFEAYFGRYPHIIRKNRNAVGVLTGRESSARLVELGKDVFQYFGLGCRNVSKLYLPENYNFDALLEAFHEYREIVMHDKYKNNFDYNYTLLILNKIPYKANGCILMTEDTAIPSRIASLHYEYYTDVGEVVEKLEQNSDAIQCIVSQIPLGELEVTPFGKAQQPRLNDYADGVDTMNFLLNL